MAGGGEETNLEYTPTWVVAAVCSVIVAISLAVERLLHYTGKACTQSFSSVSSYEWLLSLITPFDLIFDDSYCSGPQYLKKKKQMPLFEALHKIQEGFVGPSSLHVYTEGALAS